MTDETYNGWTNRQTWLVHLWLTNDEGTYNATREIVADRLASDMETDRYILGGILEDWTEQVIYGEDVAPANLSTDLVNDALGRVNWAEIADAFTEE